MTINNLINELQELTNIEIIEKSDKAVKVKLVDFGRSKITDYDYIVINKYDYYLLKAIELAKLYRVKTEDGLLSLRDDIREVENHLLGEEGENYIFNGLKKRLYDKDPYCENRLSIYQLEERLFFENNLKEEK